jgi:diaminopimelate decarboxylase
MKQLPFTKKQIEELAKSYQTPFYVYDEEGIKKSAKDLINAFSWNEGFKEYFAVKATPNPAVLSMLKTEGCGADCSSLAELVLAERVGLKNKDIIFTSNNTAAEEFVKAVELGAIINLDDISHLEYLEKAVGLPDLISYRFNPGTKLGNDIIGSPEEAKFGLTRAQMFEAYAAAKSKGVKRFGLHTMLASNELDPKFFINTADMIFDLANELKSKVGIDFEFVNLGGGLGIPYKTDQKALDLEQISIGIKDLYVTKKMNPVKLFFESGRYITGPHGYLISRVRHIKRTYKNYLGIDATMADLMRPGMYGAYHHVTVLGKENLHPGSAYDITGSLCENNDKFAINRGLPPVEIGDIIAIHDAGAHGHSMGFNYNGKLRSAEFLMKNEGPFEMIRRAETLNDYFATLDF